MKDTENWQNKKDITIMTELVLLQSSMQHINEQLKCLDINGQSKVPPLLSSLTVTMEGQKSTTFSLVTNFF